MSYFTDKQAKDIWKARWRGESVQSLIGRYGQNTFRFYEVWMETRNVGSRLDAYEEFKVEAPHLAVDIDPQPHTPRRRVVQKRDMNDNHETPGQLGFPF
ncbi:hypothetical protein SAMN05428967_1790 [Phyllobacterium sp. YR620]|nr:hypothetical protein SAMN05428967_1790 [Phyllobacterium sp. YR620]